MAKDSLFGSDSELGEDTPQGGDGKLYRLAAEDYSDSENQGELEDVVKSESVSSRGEKEKDRNAGQSTQHWQRKLPPWTYRQPIVNLYPDIRIHPAWKVSS